MHNSQTNTHNPKYSGLSEPDFERSACGLGVVADITGKKSHSIIRHAMTVLGNLEHRGATGADPLTGDGAGILIQMPHAFMKQTAESMEIQIPGAGEYAVGMFFMPQNPQIRSEAIRIFNRECQRGGLEIIGWRKVPVSTDAIGKVAASTMPCIMQCFIVVSEVSGRISEDDLERKLYLIRKRTENAVSDAWKLSPPKDPQDDFYICSLSARTLVYKGLLLASQVSKFYQDLESPKMESAFGIIHSRFSTNTLGAWKLAHPYRFLAHNGEINTLRGNLNWTSARENTLASDLFGEDIKDIRPVCERGASDTASLDNCFELLCMSGRTIAHTAAMVIPAAWFGHESMPQHVKDFYEYHSCIMEPWDGPAMIVFTDGRMLGATLDRNGLRPFRYYLTKDGLLVMASEAGVLPIEPERIALKERLAPGRMFLVDFDDKRIVPYEEIINGLASRRPYGEWLAKKRFTLDDMPEPKSTQGIDLDTLVTRQAAFGYTEEDLKILLEPMMKKSASQPVGSMGNDAPLAVLSDRPQPLFHYFKQLFAQVSNPPLDAIREKLVTQMAVPIGRRQNLLAETQEHCNILRIDHPIMRNAELARIKDSEIPTIKAHTIPTLFSAADGLDGLTQSMKRICEEAKKAINEGCSVLILSDRGITAEKAYIPILLATSAIHHYLIRMQIRNMADVIVESGEPREVHHFATLFGYGASAINPYLAFETLAGIRQRSRAESEDPLPEQNEAEEFYRKTAETGVLKTISKMGISTLQGYIGAQQFEALGLSSDLVNEYFTWSSSRIGGIGLKEIAEDVLANHSRAFLEHEVPGNLKLDVSGLYLWRGSGERHGWNPNTVALLQDATTRNDWQTYLRFEDAADSEPDGPITIRGLLDIDYGDSSVPLEEVEPASSIVRRFATGAISLGSISREAHETLAIAMNRIGARSNTGEGGEDPERYIPDENGDSRNSSVKQVASGRFGVTATYLANAKDIQIKMAQGAKPGEGGEIPGHKISEYIASIRKTTPGVELISPPPHHDIYSIEDLAQLIHDLKNVNPAARIHVKLVSEVGVGIIAAGVSKGKGDVVLISGDSGGTGASPLSSIIHAGLPWELGVAETQQTLVENGLRDRITVQTDGQMKTGRDAVIAALLGAEEWGIATAALVSMGCIMLRKCHLNTCSAGIATQDPDLRRRFAGTPDAVINYFTFISESMRLHMSRLGFRTVDEMIGRVDRLRQKENITHFKAKHLNFSRILKQPKVYPGDHLHLRREQDHRLDEALDHKLIEKARPAIYLGANVSFEMPIRNVNRTTGAMLSGLIAKNYGEAGLKDGSVKVLFRGSAGQSFGAFLVNGVEFRLVGDSNDYFAKGLSGGRIIVTPPEAAVFTPEENIIIGNVALYGATGGEVYVRGRGGERFCVRNSSAKAVIEGIGDHGCEYMTGGRVVVLGTTGRNFAAGMSGGIAYVWDYDGTFVSKFNPEMADIEDVAPSSESEVELHGMIENHLHYTGSSLAAGILMDWKVSLHHFRKIMPRDYARIIQTRIDQMEIALHG